MDDGCSQNKLITLHIHLFQSTLMNMLNSIVHSSGGIQRWTTKSSTSRLNIKKPWNTLAISQTITEAVIILNIYINIVIIKSVPEYQISDVFSLHSIVRQYDLMYWNIITKTELWSDCLKRFKGAHCIRLHLLS